MHVLLIRVSIVISLVRIWSHRTKKVFTVIIVLGERGPVPLTPLLSKIFPMVTIKFLLSSPSFTGELEKFYSLCGGQQVGFTELSFISSKKKYTDTQSHQNLKYIK